MKKILCIIFVGLFVLNTMLGSSILAANEKKQTKTMSSADNGQYIPTVGSFTLRGRFGGGCDFEPNTEINGNISNWTTPDQQVRIKWKIINDYEYSSIITLYLRIREWDYTQPGIMPLILWIGEGGIVSTPDFPIKPKFYRFNVNMNPYEHNESSFIVNLHFKIWTPGREIQFYSYLFSSQSIILGSHGGGIVHVPYL